MLTRQCFRLCRRAASSKAAKQFCGRTRHDVVSPLLSSISSSPLLLRNEFSSGSSESAKIDEYQFPTREELPLITTSKATDWKDSDLDSKDDTSSESNTTRDPNDPFDDGKSMNSWERQQVLEQQQQYMSNLELTRKLPIQSTPPTWLPPNVASDELGLPTMHQTTLPNGLRVVSQEWYTNPAVSTIGVLANAGSRLESPDHPVGITHLLQSTAFRTGIPSIPGGGQALQEELQRMGAAHFCMVDREQAMWCLDLLRPNVAEGMAILKEAILEQPRLTPEMLEENWMGMQYQIMDLPPELILTEAMQQAAYGSDQQLGKAHYASLENLTTLNGEALEKYMQQHIFHNPKQMVVSGVGIDHDELASMAKEHFGHLQQQEGYSNPVIPSVYRGGHCALPILTEDPVLNDGTVKMALAFEVEGGWHAPDDKLVVACVLQTLLGGGNSFSAGGPGKGMYSRLYREVLRKATWAESAECTNVFHSETGLLAIGGSAKPIKAKDLLTIILVQWLTLARELVKPDELDRAKNMLRGNVLGQLESRLVTFEDMGRQILTYGHRETNEELTRKIDAVTAEDILQLVQGMTKKNMPTFAAAIGANEASAGNLPQYEQIQAAFQKLL